MAGEHRITVDQRDEEGPLLLFIFTSEGLITDAIVGGEVVATSCALFDDIAAELGSVS
jgi:hypothetical protein